MNGLGSHFRYSKRPMQFRRVSKRGMNGNAAVVVARIWDRIDMPPIRPTDRTSSQLSAEVLETFERYAKLFHEIFGGR